MKKFIFNCLLLIGFHNYSQSTLCLTPSTVCPLGTFSAFTKYTDFNNDGQMDFVAVDFTYQSNFYLTLSNGSGGYQPPIFYSGNISSIMNLNDFNNDGNQDISYIDTSFASVTVLKGNGTGVLTSTITSNAGVKPWYFVAEDFNSDGKKDIALTNKGTTHFSLLLGTGSGSFSAPVNINCAYFLKNIYSTDFNNDGKKDILVSYTNSNNLSVYKGGGNGTFTLTSNYNPGYPTDEISINDFNNDTKLDLAIISSSSPSLSIINGSGNCTFTSQTSYSVSAYKISSGDLNGDGKADIAIRDYSFDFSLLLSNTTNTFQPVYTYTAGNPYFKSFCGLAATIFYVDIFDFNNDSKKDILVSADNCGLLFAMLNCSEVGIAENKKTDITFNLFPNPANELLNIKCETFTDNGTYKIDIYNSTGQLIKEEEITFKNQTATINTKDLQSGVYLLNLKRTNSVNVSKRFVVSR